MAVSLVNDFIRKTGLISKIAAFNQIEWFKGITFVDIVMTLILPCAIAIIISFILKQRYDKRKQRREQLELPYSEDSDSDWD